MTVQSIDQNSQKIKSILTSSLAWFMTAAAMIMLLGWIFKNNFIISGRSNWPVVSIPTAINFLCVGLILHLLILRQTNLQLYKYIKGLIYFFFVWLFATSLIVAFRDLLGLNFELEAYFWPDFQKSFMPGQDLGKMAFSTSLCFISTGIVLTLDTFKRQYKLIGYSLSVVTLLLSLAVLISYGYKTDIIYNYKLFQNMSFPTATIFFVFHFLWLCVRTAEYLPFNIQKQDRPIYISFAIIFITFSLLGIASSQGLIKLVETHKEQIIIQERIKNLEYLIVDLVSAETAGRGFVITANETYLEPFHHAENNYKNYIESLRNGKLSPDQKIRLADIETLAAQKIEHVSKMISVRKAQGLQRASQFVSMDTGKRIMDEIRVLVDQMINAEMKYSSKQASLNEKQASWTLLALVWGSLVAVFCLAGCFIFYRKNDMKRIAAESQIQDLNHILSLKLKETETLNKEMESFSYSVSHDLRAPLRAMAGFGNILLEDLSSKLGSSDIDYLKRIVAASEKMSRLIDGLLILSRLSRAHTKREAVNVEVVAETLVKDLERVEGHRQVALNFEAGSQVWADEILFQLLLQNLIGNAWKFTSKQEKPKVEVGSFLKERQTVFYVKDNGAGFDMKYSDKLFGTFQRLHFDHEFQGTGIGLATSRRIVNMHNGEIWAEGKKNKGATFYFYLGAT